MGSLHRRGRAAGQLSPPRRVGRLRAREGGGQSAVPVHLRQRQGRQPESRREAHFAARRQAVSEASLAAPALSPRASSVVDHLPGFFAGTEMPPAEWWQALWPDPAGVVTAVGIGPGMDVIDLCSGDGWFTLPMARIAAHVTAVDIDDAMIEAAGNRLVAAGVTNGRLLRGDAYALARLAPRRADFVFMANAFHGVPDKQRLARAVCGTVKTGGRLAAVNWQPRPRGATVVRG